MDKVTEAMLGGRAQHKYFYISLLVLIMFYKVILELLYVRAYPIYSYTGINLSITKMKLFESYLIVLLCSPLFISRDVKPSTISLQVLFLFFFIPFFSYYGLADENRIFTYQVVASVFLTFGTVKLLPSLRVKRLPMNSKVINLALVIIPVIALCLSFFYNGIPTFSAFNLHNVYEIRDAYKGSVFFEYSESWVAYALSPFLIGISLQKRQNLKLLFFAIFVNSFLYLGSGIKYMLFVTILAIIISVSLNRKRNVLVSLLSCLFVCLCAIFVFDEHSETSTLSHMFLIRPLISPAWNTYLYYDFFSLNPLLFFSENFRFILDSPYNVPSPVLVGDYVYGHVGGAWLTASYLANGYSNAGLFGMLLFSFLLGLIMKVADSIYLHTNNLGLCVAFVVALNHIIHTSLLTALFSRGILFTVLLGWVYWRGGRFPETNIGRNAKLSQ